MKPFKVEKLPIQYTLDKELIVLISEANLKYGEYKSNLKHLILIFIQMEALKIIIMRMSVIYYMMTFMIF